MNAKKKSLINIKGKLSRSEMKKIMAGTRDPQACAGNPCGGGGSGTCKSVPGGCECSVNTGTCDSIQ